MDWISKIIAIWNALKPATPYNSPGLEASAILRAAAADAVFVSLLVQVDATAPSGTYYVQLLAAGSLPADGAVTHLRPPISVAHTLGTPDLVTFDDCPGGIPCPAGAVAVLSTTQFTKTIAGAYCLFAGSVR
jgi:hypothetical protein